MNEYSFDSMIGNANSLTLIKRQLVNHTFARLTLLSGIYGTGKSTTARLAAMQLTCENPNGANPCCRCQSCRNNMRAFESNGTAPNVKIVNLGILENKSDVNELIKDIFILRHSDKAMVYIFEEVHILKNLQGAQTAFLAEIDRMPPNTYVIMCTTNERDVIPELISRSLRFQFNKLSRAESLQLIKKEAGDRLAIPTMSLIAHYSKGIPRNILNSIKFVIENDVSVEEYKEFVQDISDESLGLLFSVMQSKDITQFIDICDEMLKGREPGAIYTAIKEYLVNALFLHEGADTELANLTKSDMTEVFNLECINRCLSVVDKYNYNLSETDLRLMFYKLRLAMQARTVKDVFTDTSRVASSVNASVMQSKTTTQQLSQQSTLKQIDVSKLQSFQ